MQPWVRSLHPPSNKMQKYHLVCQWVKNFHLSKPLILPYLSQALIKLGNLDSWCIGNAWIEIPQDLHSIVCPHLELSCTIHRANLVLNYKKKGQKGCSYQRCVFTKTLKILQTRHSSVCRNRRILTLNCIYVPVERKMKWWRHFGWFVYNNVT